MRILFLTFYFEPDLCAGSFRNTPLFKELISQLTGKDFVHVVTTHPNRYNTFRAEKASLEEGVNYRIDRIRIPQHKSGFIDQTKSFRIFYKEVLKMAKSEKYDLVYASSSRLFTAFLGHKIAVAQKALLYLDIRDIFVDTMKDIFYTKPYIRIPLIWVLKRIEMYTFSKATHINLVSEGFREYFKKYTRPSYSFFTNGIDDIFLDLPETTSPDIFTKKIRYPEKNIITYAGNIGSGQGLEKIIPQAALQLGNKYLFRIIGDGGKKGILVEILKKLKVENVEILNPVSRNELIQYYRESDYLFLHLNDLDAFKKVLPSKLFEYSVFEKPIIAGVSGYAREFIRQNLPGSIVFHPTDANDFVQQLRNYSIFSLNRKNFIEKYARKNIMRSMAESIRSLWK